MSNSHFILFCSIWVTGALHVNALDEPIGIYEIRRGDFSLKITNFGARIMSLFLPDKNGNLTDVVLGYDTIEEYQNDDRYFRPIVGRVGNRIAGAQFTLNGTTYKLNPNEGTTTIHGGTRGFSHRVWNVTNLEKDGPARPSITLAYYSPDGEEGFSGAILATVTYAITAPYKLIIKMKAKVLNKATPVNLAQHTFFNLGGHNSGDILSDEIQVFASNYIPFDSKFIPIGESVSVKGTPYDFLKPQTIQSGFDKLPQGIKGINVNYDMDNVKMQRLKAIAAVRNKNSGRVMRLWSNAPAMQLYIGSYIDVKGKGGYQYKDYAGLVLETQGFPDSVNHPGFPSQILYPGNIYGHVMKFEFSTT